MAKKSAKPTTKTLREEDIVSRPKRRPAGVGVPARTGLRGGDFNAAKNANNGEGTLPVGGRT